MKCKLIIKATAILLTTMLGDSAVHAADLLRLDTPRSGIMSVTVDLHGRKIAMNGVPMPSELPKLRQDAESGQVEAQFLLARFFDREANQSITNKVQAYKWAFIAASQAHQPAKFMVKEFDLFVAPQQRAEGKSLAEAYLAARKQ